MQLGSPPPTNDVEALKVALLAQSERAVRVEAELAAALAKLADDAATIAHQKLEIAKLKRQIFGPRSERSARLIEQMELELEDLEAAATEDEIAAERAAAKTTTVKPFQRKRPTRKPFRGARGPILPFREVGRCGSTWGDTGEKGVPSVGQRHEPEPSLVGLASGAIRGL